VYVAGLVLLNVQQFPGKGLAPDLMQKFELVDGEKWIMLG